MKILYLAHRIPYPPNKGDKIRSFNEIKYLSQSHDIHLACLADDPKDLKYEAELTKYCKTVRIVPINPQLAKLKSIFYLLTKQPLTVPYFYSRKLQQTIDHLLSANDYDAIFCFSSPMAEYVFKSRLLVSSCLKLEKSLVKGLPVTINQQPASRNQKPASRNQQPKLIMDFVDVDSDKWTQYSKYARFPKSWIYALEGRRLADYERTVAEAFDHSIFVTQAEVEVFKKLNPHIQSVIAISNGVDLDYFSPTYLNKKSAIDYGQSTKDQEPSTINRQPESRNQPPATNHHEPSTINQQLESRNQIPETSNQHPETGNKNPATRIQQLETSTQQPVIVFTGAMDYYANIDGVVWFTKEVLPLIKKEIADVQFYIIGSNPTKEVIELSGNNGVTVTGYVPDTREYLRRATVAVVPLRIARGIQNKILEAMAMGLPVVATPQAFEGIEAKPDRDLILGEDEDMIAKGVIKLIKEVSLRKFLCNSARRVVENNYCWTKNLEGLDSILTR